MKECRKERFLTKEFADKALDIYNKKFTRSSKKLTASYFCDSCKTWHLTSQVNYKKMYLDVKSKLDETQELLKSREKELFKRIDEIKGLKTSKTKTEGSNNLQIKVINVNSENQKLKRKVLVFKKKFTEKAKEFLDLKNLVLKHNKRGSFEELSKIINNKYNKNGS